MSTNDPAMRMRDVQHFGEEGGVVPVIDVAATSTFLDPLDMERTFHGEMQGCYLYSRHSNPSVNALGQKLAAMEGTEAALGVASGIAAIASTFYQLMPQGGHIVSAQTIYGGTYALMRNILPRSGITTSFVATEDLAAVAASIRPDTKIIFVETVSNPLLRVANLRALADLAHQHGAKLVVDNTFTPLIVSPAQLGADVIVHSCTKYISGASDMIAGAICGSNDFIASLIDINHGVVMLQGPVMDPRAAHELYLRLDHLPARMQAHSTAALYLAQAMEREGIAVIYPGLAQHEHHALLTAQANPGYGFGGMMAIDCGTAGQAMRLAARLQQEKFGLYAVSLGFSRTLLSCSAVSTSSEIPADAQAQMQLSEGLLRMSIGLIGNHQVLTERFLRCYREVLTR